MSDAVGSMPSLMRNDRPDSSLRARSASVWTSIVLAVSAASASGIPVTLTTRRPAGTDIGVVAHEPAPAVLVALPYPQADPRRSSGPPGRRRAVVVNADMPTDEAGAVVDAGEAERLREPGRARREITRPANLRAPRPHDVDALERLPAAQQHSPRDTRRLAHDVGA